MPVVCPHGIRAPRDEQVGECLLAPLPTVRHTFFCSRCGDAIDRNGFCYCLR